MANNQRIREAAKQAGIHLWQVADAIGIADTTFTRKLRHELPEDEQDRIVKAIEQLSNSGGATA